MSKFISGLITGLGVVFIVCSATDDSWERPPSANARVVMAMMGMLACGAGRVLEDE